LVRRGKLRRIRQANATTTGDVVIEAVGGPKQATQNFAQSADDVRQAAEELLGRAVQFGGQLPQQAAAFHQLRQDEGDLRVCPTSLVVMGEFR
jgi:hypothetical protein